MRNDIFDAEYNAGSKYREEYNIRVFGDAVE